MNVSRSAPQGAHYHADVIYGTPSWAYNNWAQTKTKFVTPRWTKHHYILYQVCYARGGTVCCLALYSTMVCLRSWQNFVVIGSCSVCRPAMATNVIDRVTP